MLTHVQKYATLFTNTLTRAPSDQHTLIESSFNFKQSAKVFYLQWEDLQRKKKTMINLKNITEF